MVGSDRGCARSGGATRRRPETTVSGLVARVLMSPSGTVARPHAGHSTHLRGHATEVDVPARDEYPAAVHAEDRTNRFRRAATPGGRDRHCCKDFAGGRRSDEPGDRRGRTGSDGSPLQVGRDEGVPEHAVRVGAPDQGAPCRPCAGRPRPRPRARSRRPCPSAVAERTARARARLGHDRGDGIAVRDPGEVDRERVAPVGRAQPQVVCGHRADLADLQHRRDQVRGSRAPRRARRAPCSRATRYSVCSSSPLLGVKSEPEVRHALEPRARHAALLGARGRRRARHRVARTVGGTRARSRRGRPPARRYAASPRPAPPRRRATG